MLNIFYVKYIMGTYNSTNAKATNATDATNAAISTNATDAIDLNTDTNIYTDIENNTDNIAAACPTVTAESCATFINDESLDLYVNSQMFDKHMNKHIFNKFIDAEIFNKYVDAETIIKFTKTQHNKNNIKEESHVYVSAETCDAFINTHTCAKYTVLSEQYNSEETIQKEKEKIKSMINLSMCKPYITSENCQNDNSIVKSMINISSCKPYVNLENCKNDKTIMDEFMLSEEHDNTHTSFISAENCSKDKSILNSILNHSSCSPYITYNECKKNKAITDEMINAESCMNNSNIINTIVAKVSGATRAPNSIIAFDTIIPESIPNGMSIAQMPPFNKPTTIKQCASDIGMETISTGNTCVVTAEQTIYYGLAPPPGITNISTNNNLNLTGFKTNSGGTIVCNSNTFKTNPGVNNNKACYI